ncbi:MAG: TRAP transporter large permease subunit, partial [Alphaproteobacteria bacterium]
MDWTYALLLLIGGVMVLIALGAPVAVSFIAVNFVGAYVFLGGEAGLMQLTRNMINSVTNFSFTPIPMFLLMGDLLFHTGLAIKAIDAVSLIIRRVPGRLSVIALVAGTIFSAVSGSTIATTAMLGSLLLPEMLRRGYDKKLAMGPIMAIGGVDMLIPPSGLAVLLGGLSGISISGLLIGGVIPGILLSTVFIAYIVIKAWLNPALAPATDIPDVDGWARWKPFFTHVVPLVFIIFMVIGSMVLGWATPTESAALGAGATIVYAAAFRALTLKSLLKALLSTATVTGMIMFIILGATTFSQILAFTGGTG